MNIKRGLSLALGLGLVAVNAFSVVPAFNVYADGLGASVSDYAGIVEEIGAGTEELTLDADIALANAIVLDDDLTLDLNGHTISYNSVVFYVHNGTFTVKDSVGGGKITTSSTATTSIVEVDGESSAFVLKNGTLEALASNSSTYGVYALDGGSATIEGGEISTIYGACLSGNNTTGDMNFYVKGGTLNSRVQTIYMPGQVDLQISGGTLNGGVMARMGQIEISGGTINTAAEQTDPVASYYDYSGMAWLPDALTLLGGTYASANETYGNSLNVAITGGTFNSTTVDGHAVAVYDMGYTEQAINVTITDGAFSAAEGVDAVKEYYVTDLVATPKTGYGAYENDPTIAVSGGSFSTLLPAEQLANGYDMFPGENGLAYDVEQVPSAVVLDDGVFVQTGETYTFSAEDFGKYAYVASVSNNGATISGMDVTAGAEAGVYTTVVNYGGLVKGQASSYALNVYRIAAADEDDTDEEGRDVIKETLPEAIADLLENGVEGEVYMTDNYRFADNAVEILKEAIANGDEITAKVEIFDSGLDEESFADAEEVIKERLGLDLKVASINIAYVIVYAGEDPIGILMLLNDEVDLEFEIPEDYREPAAGYKRTFYMVRIHENEDTEEGYDMDVLDTERDGDVVRGKSGKFSYYILAYEDVADAKTPETGVVTNVRDYAIKNGKIGVFVLAIGMITLGYGLILQGKAWRNVK